MIHAAAKGEPYACFVRPDTTIPFMAMPDARRRAAGAGRGAARAADANRLQPRGVQPVGRRDPRRGASRRFRTRAIDYKVDAKRQGIVDSWPADVDDSAARADWGFDPAYDFDRAFREYLIPTIRQRYAAICSASANRASRPYEPATSKMRSWMLSPRLRRRPCRTSRAASTCSGFALRRAGRRGDGASVRRRGVACIDDIIGDDGRLPREAARNTAGVAAQALLTALGERRGVALTIRKGLPLSSGLGGSAASAAAAVVAVDALLGAHAPLETLIACALEGERLGAGSAHADNIAPALCGGFVLVRRAESARHRPPARARPG